LTIDANKRRQPDSQNPLGSCPLGPPLILERNTVLGSGAAPPCVTRGLGFVSQTRYN